MTEKKPEWLNCTKILSLDLEGRRKASEILNSHDSCNGKKD